MSAEDELIELENTRCKAIAAGDVNVLNEMLDDDYFHVYGGGLNSGKSGWIDHITDVPRMPERVDLNVRIFGETAVLTGKLINRIRPKEGTQASDQIGKRVPIKEDVQAFATQVAVRKDGRWKFVSFQMTRCVD